MSKKLLIFDGNHLAYRAFYKFSNLRTLDKVNTSIVYGMPYIAESIIRRLSPDKVFLTFDGGRSKFRLDVLPSYKERDKKLGFDAEDFFRQKDLGKEIFKAFGIQVAQKKHYEADDLIAMITRRYVDNGYQIIIVSGDKDFNQLISEKVNVYNVSKNKAYSVDNCKEELGYEPEQCVDYLTLLGDKSDNIPGYPGIGPVKAVQFLEEFGSIKEFLNSTAKFGKVDKEKLEEIWKRNKKLIDLKYFYRRFLRTESIPWENPDATMDLDKLRKICGANEINSFLKPQFINTFKQINT